LIKVKYASLPNLLLDRPLIPELLQDACNPDSLAAELHHLLTDPAAAADQQRGFSEATAMLRPPAASPSECAADVVLSMLQ
jgi:lipid-A-disaccharide synthase